MSESAKALNTVRTQADRISVVAVMYKEQGKPGDNAYEEMVLRYEAELLLASYLRNREYRLISSERSSTEELYTFSHDVAGSFADLKIRFTF